MERYRPVWAEVNLKALRRNYQRIKACTESELMPIVKADAYGHGVIPIVNSLRELGVSRFGVALLEEALEVKQAFPDLTLMVIGNTPARFSEILVREDIIPAVYQYDQAEALSQAAAALGRTARLHIKVDTGMGRIGFRPEEVGEVVRIAALPNLFIEGIFTHFASADQTDLKFAHRQLERFNQFYGALEAQGVHIPIRHAANSAAIIQFPEAHFELVRPGIILYGLVPSLQVGASLGLEPVMSWRARITHVKTIGRGETVSYGCTFRAAFETVVATVPAGYADGLRRALSNRGEMLVDGQRATIIGRVCMDQTMLEVTKIPGIRDGDVVTILGKDGLEQIDATEMAGWLGTISYEIVCGISQRVPREYIEL